MSDNDVYIVAGARTPMGGLMGSLSALPAPELGSVAISAAIERAGITPADIDETFMGCVLPAGLKQAPARQAARGAGIPDGCGAVTVNKVCGSGMQTTIFAHDSIKAGTNQIVVAGGMESMSNAPHLARLRAGIRAGDGELLDHMFIDGLTDAYTGTAMGGFAQTTADDYKLTREAMDDYAIESLKRAQRAIESGALEAETAPVTVKTRKGETIVSEDEQPGKANFDKIPQLRPAFSKDGTITAANSSSISDGASALVLMSGAQVEKRGLTPLARIVAHARHSHAPELFTTAPVGAGQKIMERTGWSVDDIDLWEINEAFACVTMFSIQDLGLDPERVNVNGGACAMGHPIGSTGSRLLVTLTHALKQQGKKRGVASLCIGGGEALAMAVEIV